MDSLLLDFTTAATPDTTAPVLSVGSASGTTQTGTTLNFTSDEAGTYYYLVYAATDTAPSAVTVKAQGTALAKGTGAAAANANTATVGGLTASTAYKAYIIVEDAAGNPSLVSAIAFTTTATPDTTAPILTAGSASGTSQTGTTLNFTSNEAGTYYYLVYAATDTAPNAATIKLQGTAVAKGTDTAAASANSATVIGLTADTAYKAYIIVEDAAGNPSLVSEIAFTTTAAPDTTAPILTAGSASSTSQTGTTLNFTSDEAGTYYYLVYGLSMSSPDAATVKAQGAALAKGTGAATANANTATVSGLTASTAYKAYIIVEDAAGNPSLVSEIAFTTTATPPSAYALTVSAGTGGSVSGTASGSYASGTAISVTATPNANYSFSGWTASGVTLSNTTVNPATFAMPAGAVTLTANFTYHGDGTPPTYTDASLSQTTAAFDKNTATANYKDVSTTLYPGSYGLSAIRYNGAALTAGTDYTVSGNTYTLKKEYLATLGVGTQSIIFDMGGGADPALNITVTDTRQTVYPILNAFVTFDGDGHRTAKIDADYNKFVRLTYNGSAVDPANYTVASGSTVITLKESYMDTFANGTYHFTAEFADGYADLTLVVNVKVAPTPTPSNPDTGAGTTVPQTGDNNNMLGWLIVLGLSVLGVLCILVWRKWRQLNGTW